MSCGLLCWHRVAVHHAGAWEDARDAQLDQTLIRRTGHPAALAIIYAEVGGRHKQCMDARLWMLLAVPTLLLPNLAESFL
jgi:hypothetical protein